MRKDGKQILCSLQLNGLPEKWARVAVLSGMIALGSACKTDDDGDAQASSVVVPKTESSGNLLQGATVYVDQEGLITRYFCNEKILNLDSNLNDMATLTASCRLQRSQRGQMTIGEFKDALSKAYLAKVGDATGSLNSGEQAVLDLLLANLKPELNQDLPAAAGEQAALDMIRSRFTQVFDSVYDGKLVASDEESTVLTSDAKASAGLRLAGGPQALGSIQFRANAGQVTVQAQAIRANLVRFSMGSAAGSNCQAQVSSIAGVFARGANGAGVQIPVNPNPVSAATYSVNNGVPVDVYAVSFNIRNGLLGRLQTCELSVIVEDSTPSGTPGVPGSVTAPSVDDRMRALMTTRPHRLWHYLWHGIRNAWPRMSVAERNLVRSTFGAGWGRNDAETVSVPQPHRGEEFFHMHREMIGKLAAVLGADMYTPWTQPPAPNDPLYPLPSGNSRRTNDEYQQFLTWHQQAVSVQVLRSMTLGQYGDWLEANIHNSMHARWSDPRTVIPATTTGGIFMQPRPEWDLPTQDNLISPYSSHVNPIFWRIHGYIDQRVNDWLRANSFSSIAVDCQGASGCYQWQRTWTGPVPPNPPVAPSGGSSGASLVGTPMELGHHDLGFDFAALQTIPKSLARLIADNANMAPAAHLSTEQVSP